MTEPVILTIAGIGFLAAMIPIPFAAWFAVQEYQEWRASRPGTDLVPLLTDAARHTRNEFETDSITVVPATGLHKIGQP